MYGVQWGMYGVQCSVVLCDMVLCGVMCCVVVLYDTAWYVVEKKNKIKQVCFPSSFKRF